MRPTPTLFDHLDTVIDTYIRMQSQRNGTWERFIATAVDFLANWVESHDSTYGELKYVFGEWREGKPDKVKQIMTTVLMETRDELAMMDGVPSKWW